MVPDMEKKESILEQIRRRFRITEKETRNYAPLTLAYMGDAIYEIIIRTIIVEGSNGTVNLLHRRSSNLVNAAAQAELMTAIQEELSEEELTIYKRGRNAKSHTSAKNASIHDYRIATGFEALMGWLYLNGEMERCVELVQHGLHLTHPAQFEHKSSED